MAKYFSAHILQMNTLTRLNLIPFIDKDTPEAVILEISQCHNIQYTGDDEAFHESVLNNPVGEVHAPVSNDEWETVAQYVNPNQEWSQQELRFAYDYLLTWENREKVAPYEFTFGPQTPFDPMRLNACVMYSICVSGEIPICRETTLYQMATICRMLINDDHYAQTVVYNTIRHVPRQGLIKLYINATNLMDGNNSPDNVIEEAADFNVLGATVTTLNCVRSLQMLIEPMNYSYAIVLAAINFNIDLSAANDPVREYWLLFRNPGGYTPQDPNLLSLVQCNPRALRLDEYFNPHLPPELYNDNILNRMVHAEGYTVTDIRQESAYALLQTAYLSCTFYHGRQLYTRNTRTPFLYEDINELDNDQIVCFGYRGGLGSMTAFRYIELGELFKSRRNFINPMVDDDTYPHIAIAKLKNLCRVIRVNDNPEMLCERIGVYNAIINTELFTDASQAKARELFEAFEQGDVEKKEVIRAAITKLFQLSMYMRGWLGEGEYPIVRAPVDNQAIVDLNVTHAMLSFELACTELEDIGVLILQLPMLKYYAGEFYPVSGETGLTISERIEIIKNGDEDDNYESCIRLSSNLFAVSSYRYMQILEMQPPFQVEMLRNIS